MNSSSPLGEWNDCIYMLLAQREAGNKERILILQFWVLVVSEFYRTICFPDAFFPKYTDAYDVVEKAHARFFSFTAFSFYRLENDWIGEPVGLTDLIVTLQSFLLLELPLMRTLLWWPWMTSTISFLLRLINFVLRKRRLWRVRSMRVTMKSLKTLRRFNTCV